MLNDADRWREALAAFDALMDLTPQARQDRLQALEHQDPGLAAQVARMIVDDAELSSVLDHGLVRLAQTVVAQLDHEPAAAGPTRPSAGTRLGAFELLQPIGRGGMGEVWLARRSNQDVEQRVAIKRLHGSATRPGVLTRFLQERRILARLEHPGIARMIDAGIDAQGQPWYAMEYVEGTSITRDAAQRQLGLRERVEQLLAACEAVAYAQQHLVIHRDIKPANVLVDRDGRVKLLDFGIAKLLEDSADLSQTATQLRALSPAYAAPEQILGLPISTATDVYALGLLGYELLTGQLPHTRSAGSLPALAAELSTEQTQRPGLLLQQADAEVSSLLGVEPERIRRAFSRDLEEILLKALRSEAEHRYASAAALAADLKRWLAGHPVEAAIGRRRYRAAKFLRRHRGAVAAAAAVLLALLAGLAAALWQAERASEAAALAEQQAERAEAEAAAARRETARSDRLQSFLVSILSYDNPERQDQRGDISLSEAVADAARRAELELADDPALLANLQRNFAVIASGRLDVAGAESHLLAALASIERVPEPSLDTATVEGQILQDLAALRFRQGRQVDALPLLDRALPLLEASGQQGLLAEMLRARGGIAVFLADEDGAADYFERSLLIERTLSPPSPPTLLSALWYRADTLLTLGRADEATPLLDEAEALALSTEGERSPLLVQIIRNRARVEQAHGRFETEAEWRHRALQLAEQNLPRGHPWRALVLQEIGSLEAARGDLVAAEDWLLRSIDAAQLTPARSALRAQAPLMLLLSRQGRHGEAQQVLEAANASCVQPAQRRGSPCLQLRLAAVQVLARSGRIAEAHQELDRLGEVLGMTPALPLRVQLEAARIALLYARGDTGQARELKSSLLLAVARQVPPGHPFLSSLQEACERCANVDDGGSIEGN